MGKYLSHPHIHTENNFSPHLPAESVIWPPLIHGLVYSKKCECLFLMDGTQPETGGQKEKNKSKQERHIYSFQNCTIGLSPNIHANLTHKAKTQCFLVRSTGSGRNVYRCWWAPWDRAVEHLQLKLLFCSSNLKSLWIWWTLLSSCRAVNQSPVWFGWALFVSKHWINV